MKFKSRLDWAIEKGLDKDFIEDLYKVIHLGSINVQNKIINRKRLILKYDSKSYKDWRC